MPNPPGQSKKPDRDQLMVAVAMCVVLIGSLTIIVQAIVYAT